MPLARLDIQRAPLAARIGIGASPPDRADRSGRFVVRQLEPLGPVVLRAHSLMAATLEPMMVVPSKLDGPVRLVIADKHACRLSGQVVDRHGKPLPEASVSIVGVRQMPMERSTGQTYLRLKSSAKIPQVAADGTFTSEALYSGDTYELQVTAPGYGARQGKTIVGVAGQDHDMGRVVLDAVVNIRGVVVDAEGEAVPHAELQVAMPAGPGQSAGPRQSVSALVEVHADAAGAFELPRTDVQGVLRIWARSARNTTDGPASFFPDLIDGPLRIELARRPGLRIVGQVADLQGRPVQALAVVIWCSEQSGQYFIPRGARGGFGGGFVRALRGSQRALLDGAVADAEGSLLADALWPDQQYYLVLTADGYQKLTSATISGAAGETIDLGRLIMRRENLAIEGEVVDARGQPVVNATVSNSGDAPQALSAVIDTAGRFRLKGFVEGPAHLLIRKPGYWPAGLRCTSGDVQQRVRLVELEQPRPRTRLPEPSAGATDHRELALRLLTELWEKHEEDEPRNRSGYNTGSWGGDVIRRMANLDYKKALTWSAAEGGALDEVIRIRAFDQIVHDDIGLAIANAGAPGASSRMKWMARRRLTAGARNDAVRLLEAALNANPTSEIAYAEPSAEIITRAQIGALAIAAGREEWGRTLVNEAADQVEKLGKEADAPSRAAVAAALAIFDAPRAVRIWVLMPQPAGGISAEMHGELAALVGTHDLAAARRIMTRSSGSNLPGRRGRASPPNDSSPADFNPLLLQIARRLAATDPEKALTLLGEEEKKEPLEHADVLARIAMAVVPSDASRSYELIDQALALCFAAPQAMFEPITPNRAQTAARIAVMAAEASYPDMQAVVDQVLALRQPAAESSRALRTSADMIEAAWLLAVIDPPTARTVLSRIPAPQVAARSFNDAQTVSHWLQAWVMIDVEHAVELFHQVLNENRRSLTSECVSDGLLPMIDALFWSHDDRLAAALQRTSPSWFPYADD